MLWSKTKLYWMSVALFAVITACSATVIFLHRPYSGTTRKTTGQRIARMRLTDAVTGQEFIIPSKHTTFIFYYNSTSPQSLQDVSYAAYLVDRFHPKDVDFVAVSGTNFVDLEQMRRTGALPFPLIVDSSYSVARELTVPKDTDRSFVIGQDGNLLFAPWAESFSPEDIRELFERYTDGHINYAPGPPAAKHLLGKPFPNIRVKEMVGGKIDLLFNFAKPGRTTYLIFTAYCPACMLDSTLHRLQDEVFSANVTPVITSRVPEVELRGILSSSHVSSPIYLAQSEIHGFEDLYFDFGALEASVLFVTTNKDGIITRVEPLQ